MKRKYLLLFTDFFPFDKWEPYLKSEFKFLPAFFDRIFIFSNHAGSGEPIYALDDNVEAHFIPSRISWWYKLASFRFFFSPVFWKELKWVKNHYRLPVSPGVIKIALLSLMQAVRYKRQIENFIARRKLYNDEVFIYSYWADFRAIAAALMKNKYSVVAVSRTHGWDVYFERHTIPYLPYKKLLSENLDRIFFVSEDGKTYFSNKVAGTNSEKLKVTRLAIEGNGKNPDVASAPFILVSCSRIVSLKRIHLIGEILQYVNDLPIQWIHFGSGPAEAQLLGEMSKKLTGKSNIQIDFRGDINHDELLQFYKKQHVDLFILTSEYEGMPFVIIEALSFGIPVMATNVGGIGEVISDLNGFLLPKNFTPSEAARQLIQYASLPEEQKLTYRQEAFKTWDKLFNAEKNFNEFARELISIRSHGG